MKIFVYNRRSDLYKASLIVKCSGKAFIDESFDIATPILSMAELISNVRNMKELLISPITSRWGDSILQRMKLQVS